MAHYIDRSSHDLSVLLIEIASAETTLDELGAEESMTLTGRILSIKKQLELLLEALEQIIRLSGCTYSAEPWKVLRMIRSEAQSAIAAARGEEKEG